MMSGMMSGMMQPPSMMTLMKIKTATAMAAKDGKITKMEIKKIVPKSMGEVKTMDIVKILKMSGATTPMMTPMLVKMLVMMLKKDIINDGTGDGG